MDICDVPGGKPLPRRELQLQGPRPSALKIRDDSYKIKKLPPPPQQQQQQQLYQKRPPVIIYTVSPKIIHTKPSEFMSLVQRLTGVSTSSADESTAGVVAAVEIVPSSPEEESRARPGQGGEKAVSPRILSLLPPSSTPISSSVFSPTVDLSPLNFMNELSPGLQGSKAFLESNFLNSPGNLLSTPAITSPSTYWDLFNQYKEL